MKFILFMIFSLFSTVSFAQFNIVAPSIAGAGTDIQARILAKHLPNHLPNNPRVNVINMQGAGGLNMTNWMYNVAEPNTHIAILNVNNETLIRGILGDPSAKYDLHKFKWLFSAEDGDDNVFVLWANTKRGLQSIKNMTIENEFIIGNTGPNNIQTYILEDIVGVKSKIVYGYKDVVRALQINEIDARFGTLLSARIRHPDWLRPGFEIQPILQVGSFRRNPLLPNVPNAREFARTEDHRRLLDFYERNVRLSRLVFGPPNMSDETVRMITKAVVSLEKDPNFIEDIRKIEMEPNFIHYEETNRLLKELLTTDKNLLRRINSR